MLIFILDNNFAKEHLRVDDSLVEGSFRQAHVARLTLYKI